jgi:hypothetical protein
VGFVFLTRDFGGVACCASKPVARMNTDTTMPKVRIATLPDLFVDCFVKTRRDSKTGDYIALRIVRTATPFFITEVQQKMTIEDCRLTI